MAHKYYLGARVQIAAMLIAKKCPDWINRGHSRAKLALLVFSILAVAFVIQGIVITAVHLRTTSEEAPSNSSSISMVRSHTLIESAIVDSTSGPSLDTNLRTTTAIGPGSGSSTMPLQTTLITSTPSGDSWTAFITSTIRESPDIPFQWYRPVPFFPHQPVVSSRVGSPMKYPTTCTAEVSEFPGIKT